MNIMTMQEKVVTFSQYIEMTYGETISQWRFRQINTETLHAEY